MGKAFSCKGIALALDFFRLRGFIALAFLPDTYLDFERVGALKYVGVVCGLVERRSHVPS